jgi:hypothetical protein
MTIELRISLIYKLAEFRLQLRNIEMTSDRAKLYICLCDVQYKLNSEEVCDVQYKLNSEEVCDVQCKLNSEEVCDVQYKLNSEEVCDVQYKLKCR